MRGLRVFTLAPLSMAKAIILHQRAAIFSHLVGHASVACDSRLREDIVAATFLAATAVGDDGDSKGRVMFCPTFSHVKFILVKGQGARLR